MRSGEALKAQMRAAALQLFEQKGFKATKIEEVAAAAGVVKATFFNYWRSKDDLLVEVLEELDGALALRVARMQPAQPARSLQSLARDAEEVLAPYVKLAPVLAVEIARRPTFKRLGLRSTAQDPTGFSAFTDRLSWDEFLEPLDRGAMAQVMADIWCAVLMDWLREPGSSFAARCGGDLEHLRKLVFRER